VRLEQERILSSAVRTVLELSLLSSDEQKEDV
jgi:hypothetical protein